MKVQNVGDLHENAEENAPAKVSVSVKRIKLIDQMLEYPQKINLVERMQFNLFLYCFL